VSETYTKLLSSITASTIWMEPNPTRITWITMLAMCDQNGHVFASVPGLAHIARVSLEECVAALECFLAPDPYSRSSDNEGRRIEPVDGGWRLLNHATVRSLRDPEVRREQNRLAQQRFRDKNREDDVSQSKPESAGISPSDQIRSKQKAKDTVQPAAARFADFWAVYPNKKGRKDAERHWKAQKADAIADQIIEHVRTMLERDDGWRRGYVPMGSTYVNGRRWEDEPKAAPVQDRDQRGVTAPPPKNIGAAAAFVPSESKFERQNTYLRQQRDRGAITDDELAAGLAEARQKYGNGGAHA
jgi:hypothetical protein